MGIKVLVVDDSRLNIKLLTDILEKEGYDVHSSNNGFSVVELTHETTPDIILLDIIMPGIDGYEVCRRLKADHELKDIPVIMITSKTGSSDIREALELGAFDYIKKPVDEVEVIARLQSALRFKKYQDRLKEMAMKDHLTGLYNRMLLIELLEKELANNKRGMLGTAFVMLDVDNFKKVNDTYGHLAGDMILSQLSQILTSSVRIEDVVGRYGGEEFGIVLKQTDEDIAIKICERIRKRIEKFEFQWKDYKINITISIGLCYKKYVDEVETEEIIRRADHVLYKAKTHGKNRIEVYG